MMNIDVAQLIAVRHEVRKRLYRGETYGVLDSTCPCCGSLVFFMILNEPFGVVDGVASPRIHVYCDDECLWEMFLNF